jgi:chromosome segregation ATPase
MCYNPQCNNKSVRFEYVEKKLLNGLEEWLNSYEAHWNEHQPSEEPGENVISIKKKLLQNLTKELKELEQQKERLHDFLERQIYDEATYLDRSKNLSERIKQTEEAISSTEVMIKQETKREKARKDVIPTIKKILKTYSKTKSPAVKNQMLKSVLSYATYRKEQDQKGDEFTLDLVPKIK